MTKTNEKDNVISMLSGFTGADLTISWFFGNTDIPHKIKEVWMSGIEFTRIPRFSAKPKHQERIQTRAEEVL